MLEYGDAHVLYLKSNFVRGKLDGLVQAFGLLTNDPMGHCASQAHTGLSFIGWYTDGKPSGPCWRGLIGGSWIYGIVNSDGDFTGDKDMAYIYPDLELALIGKFEKGIMVYFY